MEYSKSLKLDMNPSSVPPVIRVKQGDGFARYIQVTMTRDGVTYIPESGITYLFRCQKPDGTAVITDSVSIDTELERKLINVDPETGVIIIEVVDQVDAVVGRCKCDLCLLKEEKALSTVPFVIEVVASPDVANRAVSSDDFRTLENLVGDVAEAVEEAREAVDAAEQAVEDAGAAVDAAEAATTTANTAATNANEKAAEANTAATAANTAKDRADTAASNIEHMTATAQSVAASQPANVTVTGGTASNPFNLAFDIPAAAGISSTVMRYGYSLSQSTYPTTWVADIEQLIIPDGAWVWTKITINFSDERTPVDVYMKAAQGFTGPPGIAVQDTEPQTNQLVWIDTDGGEEVIIPDINDNVVALDSTYSSSKIESLISGLYALSYGVAQTLTESQQYQAYSNLGFPNNTAGKLGYTVVI